MIFSWAEHSSGKMVHVDSVPQGLLCDCICPKCGERLLARHGEIRHHGFAHHSEMRGANLKICYMVTIYKLAEHIISSRKRIHAPSYYGIFRESDIVFSDVKVDGCYDREDKQPDIIATSIDGKQYLIEFTFAYKVQHKNVIDYKNLNCLEIDLSNQTFETVENFLLNSAEDRKWLNNETFFRSIESAYSERGKEVRVTDESKCIVCSHRYDCVAVKQNGRIMSISNSGTIYRLCKPELLNRVQAKSPNHQYVIPTRINARPANQQLQKEVVEQIIPPEERTCFMCKSNLDWMCRDSNIAHCGPYPSMGVPKNTPPDTAKTCKGFKPKQ